MTNPTGTRTTTTTTNNNNPTATTGTSSDNLLLDFCEWFHTSLDPVVQKFVAQHVGQFDLASPLREEQSRHNAPIYAKYKATVEQEFQLWLRRRAEQNKQSRLRRQRALRIASAAAANGTSGSDVSSSFMEETPPTAEDVEAERALERQLAKEALSSSDETYALTLMQVSDVVTYESLYALMALRRQALNLPTTTAAAATSTATPKDTSRKSGRSPPPPPAAALSSRRGSKSGTQPLSSQRSTTANTLPLSSRTTTTTTKAPSTSPPPAAAGVSEAMSSMTLADVICRSLDEDINTQLKQASTEFSHPLPTATTAKAATVKAQRSVTHAASTAPPQPPQRRASVSSSNNTSSSTNTQATSNSSGSGMGPRGVGGSRRVVVDEDEDSDEDEDEK